MSEPDDIVARLRRYRRLVGGEVYPEICGEAADEIERLHRDYSCICSEMRRMMDERDEARRMWCEAAPVGNSLSVDDMDRRARAEATRRGWDCYKESTDGK